jgi:hypothetical protein
MISTRGIARRDAGITNFRFVSEELAMRTPEARQC